LSPSLTFKGIAVPAVFKKKRSKLGD